MLLQRGKGWKWAAIPAAPQVTICKVVSCTKQLSCEPTFCQPAGVWLNIAKLSPFAFDLAHGYEGVFGMILSAYVPARKFTIYRSIYTSIYRSIISHDLD